MSQPLQPPKQCRDDPAIAGDERLWRMIHPSQLKPDPNSQCKWTPVSGAFVDQQGEMSVDRASLRKSVAETVKLKPYNHVAEFTAREVRDLGYHVYPAPTRMCRKCGVDIGEGDHPCPHCGELDQIEPNPSHAIVCPKLTRSAARKISERPDVLVFLNPKSIAANKPPGG